MRTQIHTQGTCKEARQPQPQPQLLGDKPQAPTRWPRTWCRTAPPSRSKTVMMLVVASTSSWSRKA